MPELDLPQPLIDTSRFKDPSIQVITLWPNDYVRNPWPDIRDKQDDAVIWGVSVALRWLSDQCEGRQPNADLNMDHLTLPWTIKELDSMGERGIVADLLWWKQIYQHPQLPFREMSAASAVIALVPGVTRGPFSQGFAWGGSNDARWDDPRIPPIITLGDFHYSMFQTRNSWFTNWASTIPGWWPRYQHKWEYVTKLLCHELGHALGDFWIGSHPEDGSIMDVRTFSKETFLKECFLGVPKTKIINDNRWWLV